MGRGEKICDFLIQPFRKKREKVIHKEKRGRERRGSS